MSRWSQSVWGWSTCPLRRACRSWAYSAWNRDGLDVGSPAPAALNTWREDSKELKSGSSQQSVVRGNETMGRSWKNRDSDWGQDPFFHGTDEQGCGLPWEVMLVPSSKVSRSWQGIDLSSLVWAQSWSCLKRSWKPPDLPSHMRFPVILCWQLSEADCPHI